MKHWYLITLVFSVTLISQVSAKTETQAENSSEKCFSKSTFIDQAIRDIKEEIADGKGVFRVKKAYQLEGQKPLAIATKIDYCGYRQKPTSRKEELKSGIANQTIEVIYKPHDAGRLSLVTRNASGRSCHTEVVTIPSVTCA